MGPLMESKLAYAMRKDVANPSKMKFWYISDPRNEVNERMDNDRRRKCVCDSSAADHCEGNTVLAEEIPMDSHFNIKKRRSWRL